MHIVLVTLLACGEKEEDTAIEIEDTNTEDTAAEETDTEDTGTVDSLEMIGMYIDNWGSSHDITQENWTSAGSIYNISQFDNEADWLIAQNDAANEYNPELFSKFQWSFDPSGTLFYCQSAYDAATEQDAMSAAADPNDLDTGCGGFSWSELRVNIDLTGNFTDNWGGSHSINSFTWTSEGSTYHISQFDNEADWLIAQNDAANEYNPELFSKFQWVADSEGSFFYCQSAYDAATEQDAMSAAADPNDLDTGCGGFSWSELTVE